MKTVMKEERGCERRLGKKRLRQQQVMQKVNAAERKNARKKAKGERHKSADAVQVKHLDVQSCHTSGLNVKNFKRIPLRTYLEKELDARAISFYKGQRKKDIPSSLALVSDLIRFELRARKADGADKINVDNVDSLEYADLLAMMSLTDKAETIDLLHSDHGTDTVRKMMNKLKNKNT